MFDRQTFHRNADHGLNLASPQSYRDHMSEVKRRFRAIDRILGAQKPRTLSASFDDEFKWLQLR
jgi:hypothetical protein